MTQDKILFVGTGNMGHPIAANLIRAGYQLTLADLNPEKFADLVKLGARAAKAALRDWSNCDKPGRLDVKWWDKSALILTEPSSLSTWPRTRARYTLRSGARVLTRCSTSA